MSEYAPDSNSKKVGQLSSRVNLGLATEAIWPLMRPDSSGQQSARRPTPRMTSAWLRPLDESNGLSSQAALKKSLPDSVTDSKVLHIPEALNFGYVLTPRTGEKTDKALPLIFARSDAAHMSFQALEKLLKSRIQVYISAAFSPDSELGSALQSHVIPPQNEDSLSPQQLQRYKNNAASLYYEIAPERMDPSKANHQALLSHFAYANLALQDSSNKDDYGIRGAGQVHTLTRSSGIKTPQNTHLLIL